MFSAAELSGARFCYDFNIIISDTIANDGRCNLNSAAEWVVTALNARRYKIGPVKGATTYEFVAPQTIIGIVM